MLSRTISAKPNREVNPMFLYLKNLWQWPLLLIMLSLIQGTTAETLDPMNNHVSNSKISSQQLLDQALIIVEISEQKLYLYDGEQERADKLVIDYPVSTSKYGIGSQARSNKTPLGRHRIEKKVGHSAPKGTIFKGRQNTGRIALMNRKGAGDVITSRILWLKGLEPGLNAGPGIDSYKRYIYIHGTAEENKIGRPASHGCVRMYNKDVIDLFDRVPEGTLVDIRR